MHDISLISVRTFLRCAHMRTKDYLYLYAYAHINYIVVGMCAQKFDIANFNITRFVSHVSTLTNVHNIMPARVRVPELEH